MSKAEAHDHLIQAIRHSVIQLTGQTSDYNLAPELVRNAHLVLIGEAKHGTEEFYRFRTELVKQLINCYGFFTVVVECDWPDCYRVDNYVQHFGPAHTVYQALAGFTRSPTWIWGNIVLTKFIEWLREYNASNTSRRSKIGFYGYC